MEKEFGNSKINSIIEDTFEQIKSILSSKTIMGEPYTTEYGSVIIPVSKATVGFVLGAGEYCNLESKRTPITFPMAGGSGGGVNLTPVGFLIENANEIKFIQASSAVDNIQKVIKIIEKGVDILGDKNK